jgi:hypothetical protein
MNKRNLAAILWFFAGWMAAGGVFAVTGLPINLGPVVGLAVAGLVWWDPAHLIWPRQANVRRIRPINEVAAELERNAEAPAVDAERATR